MSVSVLCLNVHKEERALEWLAHKGADLTLVGEANRADKPGRVAPTYLTGPNEPGRNTERDCGIGVRGLPVLGHMWERISEDAGGSHSDLAPDRYAQVLYTEIDGVGVDVYSIHLNAGPNALRGKDPDHPIVIEYRKSVKWLRTSLTRSQALGREYVVGGDINLRENDRVPWTPYKVFEGRNMTGISEGLDVLLVSRGLRLGNRKVYPRDTVHSDHPGLGGDISVRK